MLSPLAELCTFYQEIAAAPLGLASRCHYKLDELYQMMVSSKWLKHHWGYCFMLMAPHLMSARRMQENTGVKQHMMMRALARVVTGTYIYHQGIQNKHNHYQVD